MHLRLPLWTLILQIEYLVDRKLPDDTSAGLVFSSKQLERLKSRIHVSPVCCGLCDSEDSMMIT